MIVAGFGCRASASAASLRGALKDAAAALSPEVLAAPADRAALVRPLAEALGLAFRPVTADELAGLDTPTRSAASLAARGVGSVAEACALAAAGPGARLLVRRCISPDRTATCAIAETCS